MVITYGRSTCSQKFQQDWKEFLAVINLESEPLFYQHYSQLMFESLIERKLKESFTDTADEIVPRLILDEENAVHYVAGYVVRKVRDSLRLPKDQAVCDILYQLIEPSVNVDAAGTSQEWTSRIDRGGLIHTC